MAGLPNIGLDARLYDPAGTGISSYTRRLILELAKRDPHTQFYLFTRDELKEAVPPHLHPVTIPIRQRFVWSNHGLPPALKHNKIALYHATANFDAPLFSEIPLAVTLHDLIPLQRPEYVSWKHRLISRIQARFLCRKAIHVFCDSEYTRQEFLSCYSADPAKTSVAYLAPAEEFTPVQDEEKLKTVLAKYQLEKGYLFCLGAVEPRKNLHRLIAAYNLLRDSQKTARPLVITGPPLWKAEGLTKAINRSPWAKDIKFTGFIPQEDLPCLYSGANLFAFPSLYEGFGLPVLEAMACGVPVVTSQTTSLPEIAGDAACLVNPESPEDIAAGITRVLEDVAYSQSLRQKGPLQAGKFKWENTARETLAVYARILSGREGNH
jgi:glycosyltransferase involved in cell wall biosynthesis